MRDDGAVWRASDFLPALNLGVVVLLGGIAVLVAFGRAGFGKQNQRVRLWVPKMAPVSSRTNTVRHTLRIRAWFAGVQG